MTVQHSDETVAMIERERDEAVNQAVVELLNAAVPEFVCVVCKQDVENHADGCPIWALEQWINPDDPSSALHVVDSRETPKLHGGSTP